jgi:hypothetical protein
VIWTLTNGATVFEISNEVSRLLRVARDHQPVLQQQTQEVSRARAAWPIAFPSRASRALELSIPVTFPPCDSLEEAFAQSLMIPVECPAGGVLTGYQAGALVTYSQAWVRSIEVTPIGLTNIFTYNFKAVDPSYVAFVLDGEGNILEDGEGEPLTWT